MVNLSLINNNNVIKSLEMKSNSKHRTSSKYGENRNTKKQFSKRIGRTCRLIQSRTD